MMGATATIGMVWLAAMNGATSTSSGVEFRCQDAVALRIYATKSAASLYNFEDSATTER
jgi:hypothetical protein